MDTFESFEFIAENTDNPLYVFGRVSEIHNFRFLQLTENLAIAYTSLHPEDKKAKSCGSSSDIYHYIKIGELEDKSIYIYHSDMVISDRENSLDISWIASFQDFKGNNLSTNRVISKIR